MVRNMNKNVDFHTNIRSAHIIGIGYRGNNVCDGPFAHIIPGVGADAPPLRGAGRLTPRAGLGAALNTLLLYWVYRAYK